LNGHQGCNFLAQNSTQLNNVGAPPGLKEYYVKSSMAACSGSCQAHAVPLIPCPYAAALPQDLMSGLAMCAAMSSAAIIQCLTSLMLSSGSSHGEVASRSLAWHVLRCCMLCALLPNVRAKP
jgi:hypothetical protein